MYASYFKSVSSVIKSISIPAEARDLSAPLWLNNRSAFLLAGCCSPFCARHSSSTPFPSVASWSFCVLPCVVCVCAVQSVHCSRRGKWLRRGAHSNRSVELLTRSSPPRLTAVRCAHAIPLCVETLRCVGMRWAVRPPLTVVQTPPPLGRPQPSTRNSLVHSFTHSLTHDACSGH